MSWTFIKNWIMTAASGSDTNMMRVQLPGYSGFDWTLLIYAAIRSILAKKPKKTWSEGTQSAGAMTQILDVAGFSRAPPEPDLFACRRGRRQICWYVTSKSFTRNNQTEMPQDRRKGGGGVQTEQRGRVL